MSDERFALTELQLEFLALECPELRRDLVGVCVRPSKAQAEIVSVTTVLEPSVVGVVDVVSGESLCLSSETLSSLLLPVLEASLCSAHQSNIFLVELSLDTLGVAGNENGFDEP